MILHWLHHHVPTLCAVAAWAHRLALRLTDCALEAALARIGEPMAWRDVERLARERAMEEERTMGERLREWDEIMERSNRIGGEVAAAGFRAFAEKVDADIMAMGGKPRLRLLSKP